MELPNYFLADLPPEATLSEAMLDEACQTLKRNRDRYLLPRTLDNLIHVISTAAREWLNPDFHIRKLALEFGPSETGFSLPVLEEGIDKLFSQITRESLEALILQDICHIRRFEEVVADEHESKWDRASMVRGPLFMVQITGGCLPNPSIASIILGLLAKAPQFIKCASGTSLLPRLFAHSIYLVDSKLASCIEVAEWKGGNEKFEDVLYSHADCVTATGSDETLTAIRKKLPAHVRFLGYGHKVSLELVTRENLSRLTASKVAAAAAEDIAAWDQLGCLSPHVIYVETGGAIGGAEFAELLAKQLAKVEKEKPRGPVDMDTSAAISTRRMFYEVRAAASKETRVWSSEGNTAWTVIFEADPDYQPSPLHRFVFVKPVSDLHQMLNAIAPLHGKVSTIGISATPSRLHEVANQLGHWGVTRICKLGDMQNPPLSWRHDGRPALADLLTWTDLEL
ncbi:MAG: acyl-CoA reductase [Verrucomicrobiales bacterium]